MEKWVSTFHIAHARFFDFNITKKRSVRIVFPNNVIGNKIRLKLANDFAENSAKIGEITIAECMEDGILTGSAIPVMVKGGKETILGVGEVLYTDEVAFDISYNTYIAVTMYFPEQPIIRAGGNTGRYALRTLEGNYCNSKNIRIDNDYHTVLPDGTAYEVEYPIPLLKSVEIQTKTKVKIVTVFGDSITAQCKWFTPFVKKLYVAYPGQVACGNNGVSGNQLLYDSPIMYQDAFGISGLHRFEEDVLSLAGLTHCIVALGTNDIGNAGVVDPNQKMPALEELLEAYRLLVKKAKGKQIKMVFMSILPRIDEMMNEEKEHIRQSVNQAVKEGQFFDQYIDLEQVMGIQGKNMLNPAYYATDGLHLNDTGGLHLCQALDVKEIYADE